MTRCLVTGSSGFIGRHLVRDLLKKGHRVIGLTHRERSLDGFLQVRGDLRYYTEGKFKKLCERVDVVFHLAGVTENRVFTQQPSFAFETNVVTTLRLLKAFSKSRAKHFIYPSSGKVYGHPVSLPLREDHPRCPTTPLGKTKQRVECAIEELALLQKKRFTILRIFNLYGPGQKGSFFIPTLLNQSLHEDRLRLGDVVSKRDFLYISDLIQAFTLVMRRHDPGLICYNVGSGRAVSPSEIIRILKRLLHRDLHVVSKGKRRKGEFSEERADIRGLRRLGWDPKISLKKGLQKCLQERF